MENIGCKGVKFTIYRLILTYYNRDKEKARLWLKTENPNLGKVSPNFMIKCGREDKLLKFIKASKAMGGW